MQNGEEDESPTTEESPGGTEATGVQAEAQRPASALVRAPSQNVDRGGSCSSGSWASSSDAGSSEMGAIGHQRRRAQTTIGKVTVANDNGNSVQVADTVQNIHINTPSAALGQSPYVFVLPPGTAPRNGNCRLPHVVSLKGNGLTRSTDSLVSGQSRSSAAADTDMAAPGASDRKARIRTCLLRTLAIVLCAGMAAVLAALPWMISGGTDAPSTTTLWPTTTVPVTTGQPPTGMILVKRWEWGAVPARKSAVLKTPVETVIIQHTETASCFNETLCTKLVARIQRTHMERRYDDITYNFLVGGDGVVYEGRGWDTTPACGARWNHRALCLAVIGDFTSQLPAAAQSGALKRLLAWAEDLAKALPDYRLCGKCQLSNTTSPGAAFMAELRTWRHWYNHTGGHHRC